MLVRLHLKNKLAIAEFVCNPSYVEGGDSSIIVQGRPQAKVGELTEK
jgi:hypothetical protein